MSTYCFAERPRELYSDVFMRGYVAAARDYPRLKSFEESVTSAHALPDALREQVCCIGEQEHAYLHLVVYAWSWGYWTLCHSHENQIAFMVLNFKPLPLEEAYRLAHDAFTQDDVTELEKAYTCYLAFCRTPA